MNKNTRVTEFRNGAMVTVEDMNGPLSSVLTAHVQRVANIAGLPQTVYPSRFIGTEFQTPYTTVIGTANTDGATAPQDAHPQGEPMLTVLPDRYNAHNGLVKKYAFEYAYDCGATEAEAGEFSRYYLANSIHGDSIFRMFDEWSALH